MLKLPPTCRMAQQQLSSGEVALTKGSQAPKVSARLGPQAGQQGSVRCPSVGCAALSATSNFSSSSLGGAWEHWMEGLWLSEQCPRSQCPSRAE